MRRRRGEELDTAIRAAVLGLLTEHGPAGVTMEAVASAARTSKPVLYRRWADRASLFAAHCLASRPRLSPMRTRAATAPTCWPSSGVGPRCSPDPKPPCCGRPSPAAAHDPELRAALQNDVIGWRKKEMAALLSRGISRGDVRADVPVDIARELGQSVLWHRLLITGDPIDDNLVVRLVDEVLVPFVSPRT